MTSTATQPAKLTAAHSRVYIATKAPKGGTFKDRRAVSVRFRASSWEHAVSIAKKRGLRLDGRHVETHRSSRIAWHIREPKPDYKDATYKLYYFQQLVDAAKGLDARSRLRSIAAWLNRKGAVPNPLCVADHGNIDSAIRQNAP